MRREKTLLQKNVVIDPEAIKKAVNAALIQKERGFSSERQSLLQTIQARDKIIDQVKKVVGVPLSEIKIRQQAPVRNDSLTFKVKEQPRRITKPEILSNEDGQLTGPEQRILDAIAWLESIGVPEPEQTAVAFLAGYTFGGGGFNNPKGALRSKSLIEYRGNRLVLTDTGRALAKVPDDPLTTEELHAKVLTVLPGPEQRVLKPLLEAFPNDLSNEELADASGYQLGAGDSTIRKGGCGRWA